MWFAVEALAELSSDLVEMALEAGGDIVELALRVLHEMLRIGHGDECCGIVLEVRRVSVVVWDERNVEVQAMMEAMMKAGRCPGGLSSFDMA